jgi:septum formation protein
MDYFKKLILASASPRRRDLLGEAGYHFEIVPAVADEPDVTGQKISPEQAAQALAYIKAKDVADRMEEPAVVLGADTLVACDGDILGKPVDAAHAREMLYRLSRTHHRVITGVVLIDTMIGKELSEFAVSWITMRPMTEKEIDDYIDSGEWEGKAGGYAVQETADRYIVKIDGSFSNVVGLPMELVSEMLSAFGIHPF